MIPLAALLAACAQAPAPGLSIEGTPERPTASVSLPPRAAAGLAREGVASEAAGALLWMERAGGGQHVAGRWSLEGDTLRFEPAFALSPGTSWVVRAALPDGSALEQPWAVPAIDTGPPPRVIGVTPTADALPQNALKLYVRFSAPMADDVDTVDHVLLTELESGESDPVAWYRHRLWSEDGQRLTLVFHPGRVKSDIPFSDGLGPVLEPGRRYRVELTRGLAGADGQPLAEPYAFEFEALEADHRRPLPEDWRLEIPGPGGRDPLVMSFDEPMEPILSELGFTLSAGGAPVQAQAIAAADGRSLRWLPASPWAAVEHTLIRAGRVEDLAGNTPERAFEGPPETVSRPDPARTIWRFVPGEPPPG